ncbi:MAG: aspartate kinase [Bacteroidetes bacterium]|nr:aspartate kinase [Bacteroidota bacterium]MBM3424188.1 aspartate kinase [Bacteroidota bacterium]
MKVFKFGGASVKNAESLKNVVNIIQHYEDRLFIIVSAMDKTTNQLEEVVKTLLERNERSFESSVRLVEEFHRGVVADLSLPSSKELIEELKDLFDALRRRYNSPISAHFGFEYDQIVSLGEVLSSRILASTLKSYNIDAEWLDARQLIRTDNHYKEANVDWSETILKLQNCIQGLPNKRIFISQGFIGHSSEGYTTTLGREGSDYSAAIVAYALDADNVTIWKDVPGMLNADPKYFANTQLLSSISYKEAIELAYFGASVIHPKTVKPLQNKNIPLLIKSFVNPLKEGTVIQQEQSADKLVPSFIVKKHQILVTLFANDFSFINEDALAKIFERFYSNAIKINLMQNSALNFSTLLDADKVNMEALIELFKPEFSCRYNENVELLTVRHYTQEILEELLEGRIILLEQRSRQTARFVLSK